MADNAKFWLTYLLVVAFVLVIGWRQPLRYRFMSKQEIAELELPHTPEPATPAPPEDRFRTRLEDGPYRDRGGRR